MQQRALVVALVALLAVAGASGCLARSAAPDGEGMDANSEDTESAPVRYVAGATPAPAAAADAATAWHPDAFLVAAYATEGAPADLEDPPFVYDTTADPAVGDGLARVWTYTFAAPNESSLFFAAVADGERAIYANKITGSAAWGGYYQHRPGELPTPRLAEGLVGSDVAAAAVNDHEHGRTFAEEHPVSAVRLALVQWEEHAMWMILRYTSGGFGLSALVDAETGAIKEVHRFPQDLISCPPDADCHGDPRPPEPPETPPTEEYERTGTLDAFNPEVSLDFGPSAWGFESDVTVTAVVPGSDPVDARTLEVLDAAGFVVGRATGVGELTVAVEGQRPDGFGQHYWARVGGGLPGALPQEISILARIEYGEYLGDRYTRLDGGGASVRIRQVDEQQFVVDEGATDLEVRVQFYENGPGGTPLTEASFSLIDPNGEEVAAGGIPGATVGIGSPTPGTYTLRFVGGDGAFLGAFANWAAESSYEYAYY